MGTIRNPRSIGGLAVAASWVFLAITLAKAAADANTIRVLGGFGGAIAPMPMLEAADSISAGVALLYTLGFVVTGIIVLRWVYVTNANAQAWSPHVSITPGWNVGWFFVPVASLFKPFEGVRETYQASVDPELPADVPVPRAMRLWWGAWLCGNFLSYVAIFLVGNPATPAGVVAAHWGQIVLAAVIASQSLFLIAVLRGTTRAQIARLAMAAQTAPA